jgi:hypothetical protein
MKYIFALVLVIGNLSVDAFAAPAAVKAKNLKSVSSRLRCVTKSRPQITCIGSSAAFWNLGKPCDCDGVKGTIQDVGDHIP